MNNAIVESFLPSAEPNGDVAGDLDDLDSLFAFQDDAEAELVTIGMINRNRTNVRSARKPRKW